MRSITLILIPLLTFYSVTSNPLLKSRDFDSDEDTSLFKNKDSILKTDYASDEEAAKALEDYKKSYLKNLNWIGFSDKSDDEYSSRKSNDFDEGYDFTVKEYDDFIKKKDEASEAYIQANEEKRRLEIKLAEANRKVILAGEVKNFHTANLLKYKELLAKKQQKAFEDSKKKFNVLMERNKNIKDRKQKELEENLRRIKILNKN